MVRCCGFSHPRRSSWPIGRTYWNPCAAWWPSFSCRSSTALRPTALACELSPGPARDCDDPGRDMGRRHRPSDFGACTIMNHVCSNMLQLCRPMWIAVAAYGAQLATCGPNPKGGAGKPTSALILGQTLARAGATALSLMQTRTGRSSTGRAGHRSPPFA